MKDFDPKKPSEGLGDTIAKITHATGLDKLADAVAKAAGAEDCGCNKRRKTLNQMISYTTTSTDSRLNVILKKDEKEGNYKVLQPISYLRIVNSEEQEFKVKENSIIFINKNHPLYKDVSKYLKNNLIKKL